LAVTSGFLGALGVFDAALGPILIHLGAVSPLWLGFGCGAVLVGTLAVSAQPGAGLPPINDITTNLGDPPAFSSDPAGLGRDMSYPSEFVPQVEAAYPDLAPLVVSSEPAQALALAEQTARGLGWEVVEADPESGTLLARQTTKIFRFVDDIVVRVRPGEGGGAVIDVRSKSRDGRGDLGANATRIRAFTSAIPR
jgi:uncharacterized protein (DUF1499 family)